LLIAMCIGRMAAWASRVMVEVERKAPVMKVADVHWMRASFVVKLTEPCFFFLPGSGSWIGWHQISAA